MTKKEKIKEVLEQPRWEFKLKGEIRILLAEDIKGFIKKFCKLFPDEAKTTTFSDLQLRKLPKWKGLIL